MKTIGLTALLGVLTLVPAHAQTPGENVEKQENPPFVVGIEDVLRVVTWGEPELTLSVKVRPDGQITLPLVNEIQAAGRTTQQIRLQITEKMQDYIRSPNVTVSVEEINNFRVYFLGEVNNQGTVQLYTPTRLLQGIAMAGGLTEFSKKQVTVLRQGSGMERRIEVDVKKLWAGDPTQENIFLKPGDTLLVK